jgi:hypothetical protein
MKNILFIICILSFSVASAQIKSKPFIKAIPPNAKFLQQPQSFLSGVTLSHTLPNGNKVYLLPQDNMPCVVPDMSQFDGGVVKPVIPNYTIPNPAFPPTAKVVPFTTEQFNQQLLEKLKKQAN